MKAGSVAAGLPGPPRGVRVDESVSVSAPETEAEGVSRAHELALEGQSLPAPPGSGEVLRGG